MVALVRWLLSALTISVTAYLIPGVHVAYFITALAAALILGLVNIVVKPMMYWFALPVTVFTFGLFTFVLNALMIMLATLIVPGFSVDNIVSALVYSFVLTIVNYVVYWAYD